MKTTKPQSMTTDTRHSQSHFLSNSVLNKTNLTTSSQKNNQIPHSFQQQDSKQADFLKVKNNQLQERIKRMSEHIKQLEENKINLLKMNEKYVEVINQYYRDSKTANGVDQYSTEKDSSSTSKSNYKSREKVNKKQEKKMLNKCHKTMNLQKQTKLEHSSKQSNTQTVLHELEKDHRNLSKHCLVMETEIKNYAIEMEKFNQFKAQLLAVNHTTPKELIAELQDVTDQNKQLKKQNNRLSFELEKYKSECNRLKKSKQTQSKNINNNNEQLQKLKAQINKVTQQSSDKSHQYEQRIYQLELKVEKLEKQLRSSQLQLQTDQERRKDLQIKRVEDVHENSFLKTNLSDLLDPKKHALLKLDRSFIYKKNREKSISLTKNLRNSLK